MPTTVRSYSKINLGLAIGPPRPDGYHSLTTLYQTLALHDLITIEARRASSTQLNLTSNDQRVPLDQRNTAWKMAEKMLDRLGVQAEVSIRIQKNLPIQGGMGAGSANAAAAMIGLERELSLDLAREQRLALAAEVGSDVPLFLMGGSVLGSDRGQIVHSVPDVTLAGSTQIPCVVALPPRGVSTPQAFRDWDARFSAPAAPDLHQEQVRATLRGLSRAYASVFLPESVEGEGARHQEHDSSFGIFSEPSPAEASKDSPEKQHRLSREQHHTLSAIESKSSRKDLTESLLSLVRAGIENDFESVVFVQYPLLREIKRQLMGTPETENSAVYAALSGSGSALFGLYRCQADANAAQRRLQQHGVRAIVTTTLPRPLYWSNMFAK